MDGCGEERERERDELVGRSGEYRRVVYILLVQEITPKVRKSQTPGWLSNFEFFSNVGGTRFY
jgi:hypothetical protein